MNNSNSSVIDYMQLTNSNTYLSERERYRREVWTKVLYQRLDASRPLLDALEDAERALQEHDKLFGE